MNNENMNNNQKNYFEAIVKKRRQSGGEILFRITTLPLEEKHNYIYIYIYCEEFETFTKEYLHEHPDEIDNVYLVFNPSISVIEDSENISLYKNEEQFFNDQEQIFEALVKKRLQSGGDKILYRDTIATRKA